MEIHHAAKQKQVRADRISKLDDRVLGHVLSFLPSDEAARAAALSTRWRDAFAGVHTLSLEEPEGRPIPTYEYDDLRRGRSPGYVCPRDLEDPASPFGATITAAIVARHRRRPDADTPPLRALRVALNAYRWRDSVAVDQWVSYALKQAGPALELHLRLKRLPIYCRRTCRTGLGQAGRGRGAARRYSILGLQQKEDRTVDSDETDDDLPGGAKDDESETDDDLPRGDNDDVDDVVSSVDESFTWVPQLDYSVPGGVFSCNALRSLRIGPCRLSPPSSVSLPSLEELLLSRVSDRGEVVQRLVSACPRLVDLTLEACDTVTTLSILDVRLRRLALRCCHELASVTLDASELSDFEYRGDVPEMSFLTTFGATCWFLAMPSLASCTIDICGGEVSSGDELDRLTAFLSHFACTKHLRLRSARLGPGVGTKLSTLTKLRHLELRGHLPHDDDGATIIGTTSWILLHAPNLEVLSLVFETGTTNANDDGAVRRGCYHTCKEAEVLDSHILKYDRYNVLDAPSVMTPCLANRVREINLVHYQGGRVQRTLAKFLLCNAPAIDHLWCQFAEGPLWMQTELMREMKGWVLNEKANTVFR
ncbi:F-box/LRR-repeat protein [Hordeum vulgare]|nr:F-box/LRR-repeat protein [Hordeum vulgare]